MVFASASTSLTDNKTVVAKAGRTTLTANVLVYDFAPVLTPEDNFVGRSLTEFGVGERIRLSAFITPSITADQAGGLVWSITAGGGELTDNGDGTGIYVVPDVPPYSTSSTFGLALQVKAGPSKGRTKAPLSEDKKKRRKGHSWFQSKFIVAHFRTNTG